MPLLKRKRFDLIPPPAIDRNSTASKNCPVWYHHLTKEIFVDYRVYLERTALYKQRLWQCEFTGRSNLTYAQALKSEQAEKLKVGNNLPEALQKAVLEHAQFQNARLDAVVDNVYDFFIRRYVSNEDVECLWDDGIFYSARILEAPPLENQESDNVEYKVQLLDENNEGIEEYIKTTDRKGIKRGRLAFSKSLLKRFLREATTKESYKGAPWIVNDHFAERFGIDATLPHDLAIAKVLAYSKSRKLGSLVEKPSTPTVPTSQSRLDEARKLESMMKYPMEDLDLPTYRRNPPLANSTVFLDMALGSGNELEKIPNPTGDLPIRPSTSLHSTVPLDCFGTFLMAWGFLNVFSRPLCLSPFNLDDFETALQHTSQYYQKCVLVDEVMVALLNCIIRHRLKPGYQHITIPVHSVAATSSHASTTQGTDGYELAIDSSPNANDDENNDNTAADTPNQQQQQQNGYKVDLNGSRQKDNRGCASDEIVNIGKNWDARPIPLGNNRHGWEDIMIGCINDLAIESNENLTDYDTILNSLVPGKHSTLKQREQAYLGLGLKEKLIILRLLINAANETSDIKNYMEDCQERLTELRRQKIDINRERKRIQAERNELERQYENESNTEISESGNDSDTNTTNGDNIDQIQKKAAQVSKHESRQAVMKQKQMERHEMDVTRKKLYNQQRKEAYERNRELKIRAMARNKLDKEDQAIQRKHEQINRDMQKYSTLRFKPLGRDRFFNRYYYLDNIGGGHSHGSGKLFVQSPSVADLSMLLLKDGQESDDTKVVTAASSPATTAAPSETNAGETTTTKTDNSSSITSLCGHGGGLFFMCQLMEHQGLSDKTHYLKEDIHRMVANENVEWWESFDDKDTLDGLLAWLNPKGVREYLLKRELEKHLPDLLAGMKKRSSEKSAPMAEIPRRSTRTTKKPPAFIEPWQAYTNKLAK